MAFLVVLLLKLPGKKPLKVFQAFKPHIHRGVPHESHRVQHAQVGHHKVPNIPGGHFPLAPVIERSFNGFHNTLQRVGVHGPFVAGHGQASVQFVAVKRFSAAIPFDHHQSDRLGFFVGGEAPLAAKAFSSPPDGASTPDRAAVHDPTVFMTTKWASHT
jgi:hypothetical protein